MESERWRFEADTELVQAMEAHYDTPVRTCMHDDSYICARHIIDLLESKGVVIVPEEWLDGNSRNVRPERLHEGSNVQSRGD